MATGSMMKDYVRRQLRYWVDGFKDDMLPSGFMSKSYSKTQLLIPDIKLKPHRVAAVLHLPAPLLVTSAHCIELTIAVPSWTDSDKEAAHKPLLIHANELSVHVRNIWECSSNIRREAEERVQAALLEPDPLGSTAAMFAFARDVNDRTKLVVDKLNVQIFMGGISRLEMNLVDLNARTTDAVWQDVKDPTKCVDYSPDHLVQTRFKAMSFMLSVAVNPAGSSGGQMIRLMTKVSVDVRITRFYHRKQVESSWKRQMQLVDVNFGAVKVEFGVADFMEVYTVASMLCNWLLNGRSSESCALSSPEDGMAVNREPFGPGQADQPNIELQTTFRGTLEAKLKFDSPTEGPQELCLVADRAAGNIILHRHGVRELQLSLHELAVRFRGYVVFRLKPDREVFHLEQRRNSLSVKWRVQSVLCRIDDDLTRMLTEMYQFVNEKEQAIVIRCGTCHQQISLDMIDVHVCPPRNSNRSLTATPPATEDTRGKSFSACSSAENGDSDATVKTANANGAPKIHIELHMDELELQTGGKLVQLLLKWFGVPENERVVGRDITTKLSNLRLTTESNEFAGDAIFVPALPLAFQMLECSLQGCGCILRRRGMTHSKHTHYDEINHGYILPARLFLDISHCAMLAQECFVKVDRVQLRSSFSHGSRVCSSSQPQLSFHVTMDKVRCQLDEVLFKLSRRIGESLSSSKGSVIMTLFLGVLQIRAVEFTLQNGNSKDARAKSLLKQAIVVFDNQLGFLCTQSSLDFKTVLNSQTMKFVHRQTPAPMTNIQPYALPNPKVPVSEEHPTEFTTTETDVSDMNAVVDSVTEPEPKDEEEISPSEPVALQVDVIQEGDTAPIIAPPTPPNLEREDACRCIQRMVRRKHLVRQRKQRFDPDDYEPGVVTPIEVPAKPAEAESSTPAQAFRRESGKSLANLTLVIDAESESNDSSPSSSPRKLNFGIPSPIMVLGADADIVGEIRGGISKLMSPLSRARLPSESFRGGLNKLMAPINRTLSPTASTKRRPSVQCYNVTMSDDQVSPPKSQELRQVYPKQPHCNSSSDTGNALENKPPIDENSSKQADGSEDSPLCKSQKAPKVNGLSEAKLAALPDIVRVLVQVGECRLCIPINPREKVNFLCQEIVRRFNESFAADRGNISQVSLQDKHGGVFCPSDTVGFLLSVAPNELLFAYPHESDGPIRSLARLTAGSVKTVLSRSPRSRNEDSTRTKYSKLPLPLVIALLANESERDLIRSGLCERDGEVAGEAWPDLALNAASLDAEKNPLIVEVAWHETCVGVTNGDAFALCQQLLGLCTSRATSKYVGKILRSRLKVDPTNPLVEWACRRKLAMEQDGNRDSFIQHEETLTASYDQLKTVVQATFGVYTR